MKKKIREIIRRALRKAGFTDNINVVLTKPPGHANYASNVAMQIASLLKKDPLVVAGQIRANIKSELIAKVEAVAPGFINIFLSNQVFSKMVKKVISEGSNYGKGHQKKYINVEYVSANPTGHLHLGHARGAAVGSALVKILKFAGNTVDSDYYTNDMGNQIDILGESVFVRYQNKLGNKNLKMPADAYRGSDIIECAAFLIAKHGAKYKDARYDEVAAVFKLEARKYMLDLIQKHLEMYRAKIDKYFFESEFSKPDKIEKTLSKISKHTYKKDGALWIKTTARGDDKDRVLIKTTGAFTYFIPDLTYHNDKIERGYDEIIDIWGSDHIGYIKRMQIGLEYLGLPNEKLDILVIQTVKLFKNGAELKMSKRKGHVYTLKEIMKTTGVDAARWFMLNRACNSPVIFDIDKALSKANDNPIFTIQYTHARIEQLIQKSKVGANPQEYKEPAEIAIINHISDFGKVIIDVASSHKVHLLTSYVFNLCKKFNSWYSTTKAIGARRESSLIALAKATQIVIKNSFDILSISAPKKM